MVPYWVVFAVSVADTLVAEAAVTAKTAQWVVHRAVATDHPDNRE